MTATLAVMNDYSAMPYPCGSVFESSVPWGRSSSFMFSPVSTPPSSLEYDDISSSPSTCSTSSSITLGDESSRHKSLARLLQQQSRVYENDDELPHEDYNESLSPRSDTGVETCPACSGTMVYNEFSGFVKCVSDSCVARGQWRAASEGIMTLLPFGAESDYNTFNGGVTEGSAVVREMEVVQPAALANQPFRLSDSIQQRLLSENDSSTNDQPVSQNGRRVIFVTPVKAFKTNISHYTPLYIVYGLTVDMKTSKNAKSQGNATSSTSSDIDSKQNIAPANKKKRKRDATAPAPENIEGDIVNKKKVMTKEENGDTMHRLNASFTSSVSWSNFVSNLQAVVLQRIFVPPKKGRTAQKDPQCVNKLSSNPFELIHMGHMEAAIKSLVETTAPAKKRGRKPKASKMMDDDDIEDDDEIRTPLSLSTNPNISIANMLLEKTTEAYELKRQCMRDLLNHTSLPQISDAYLNRAGIMYEEAKRVAIGHFAVGTRQIHPAFFWYCIFRLVLPTSSHWHLKYFSLPLEKSVQERCWNMWSNVCEVMGWPSGQNPFF